MKGGHWIFGYGSLVWRPSFDFIERSPAYIEGWVRRFWQGSTDHRGVPGAPGRVVTLVEEEGARCWGMAYQLQDRELAEVLARLDFREKGGYRRCRSAIFLRRESSIERVDGLLYVATPQNSNYLGPAPVVEVAAQVRRSMGPSGPNREYVLRLARALREIGADDDHVFELAGRVEEADG